jgi:hypothetical protein
MADNPMTELETRRWLKRAKQECKEMEERCIQEPTRQLKFDLTLKVMEIRFAEAKIKNMKRDAEK